MLNRSFGTSLFSMVPKASDPMSEGRSRFGTSLFSMVPKAHWLNLVLTSSFGTSLSNMVQKVCPETKMSILLLEVVCLTWYKKALIIRFTTEQVLELVYSA